MRLTHKQEVALTSLIGGKSSTESAKLAGINEKTLDRWRRLPEFTEALRVAQQQALGTAIDNLQQSSGAFAGVLREVAENVLNPVGVRVTAARAGLEMAIRGKEMNEMESRMSAIEAALERINP